MSSPASPAARAIADHLRQARPRFPPILRFVLLGGLACVGLYVALLVLFYTTDRALFDDMLRLYGLTLIAGREPAMFAVYQEPTPVPLGWMLILALLDDVGTLLLTLPWVWFAFERLHAVGPLEPWLVGLEKSALENRRWIRRWGIGGLAAFYWLPGFGSGVLAICVAGVVARVPLRRLVPALLISAGAVSTFWALALYRTSALIPRGPLEYLPAALVVVVVALGLRATLRQRRTAHLLLLEWPRPAPEREESLARFGIRPHGGIVEVDARVLAPEFGETSMRPSRARTLAQLLLLDGMTQAAAVALESRGVGGIVDLAVLEPKLLDDALREGGLPAEGHGERWTEDARRLVAKADSAWRRARWTRASATTLAS